MKEKIRSQSETDSGRKKNMSSYSKYNKQKRAGAVIKVIEHLLSKHKVLTSNPSTTKEKKNKQRQNTASKGSIIHCLP
jgi:hypothetical protein